MPDEPLHIPTNKKSASGIHIYCGQCRSIVSKTCKETNKSLATCKHADRHKYKLVMYANAHERRTKLLDTRDYDTAVIEAIAFKREIRKQQDGENISKAIQTVSPKIESSQVRAIGLPSRTNQVTELMALYVGYLSGDEAIVPAFRRRVRTKKHLGDVERTFKYLAVALHQAGYPIKTMQIQEINETMIGKFHDYILKEKKLSNRSYNKSFSILNSWCTYLNKEGYEFRNPFTVIPRRAVTTDSKAITKQEYDKLREIIKKPELGVETLSNGVKKYHYESWLGECYELAINSGRRNYEISRMRFCDVFEDADGNPLYIRIPDYKVNRQRGLEDGDPNTKYIYVPIIGELHDLLIRLGYEHHKGTERYLIAGDEGVERDTIKTRMSRAFSHYYKQIGNRDLSFKCFRKTYISQLTAALGIEDARLITRHSGKQVIDDHYLDHKFIASTAKHFRLFQETDRMTQLEGVQRHHPEKGIDLER